jgi:hypothetical protein
MHKEEYDTNLRLNNSLSGRSETKELDQLSEQNTSNHSEENSSFTFNASSKKKTSNNQEEKANFTDLTNKENKSIAERKLAKIENKFRIFFKLNNTSLLTIDEITSIFIKYCTDNNIIDTESGYILLFRDKLLRQLFDRDFIRPHEIQLVIESSLIVSYLTEGEMKEEEIKKSLTLHQNKRILEREFFTKSNSLLNFKL